MSTTRLYFWDGTRVIEYSGWQAGPLSLDHCQCVDTHYPTSQPHHRYGKNGVDCWEHISLEDFDPVFRAHLLLLGIT